MFRFLLYSVQKLIVLRDELNQLQQFDCLECHQFHFKVGQDSQTQMCVYYVCGFEVFVETNCPGSTKVDSVITVHLSANTNHHRQQIANQSSVSKMPLFPFRRKRQD